MSENRYFTNFPLISYANNIVVDITKRPVVLDSVSKNALLFYPYEIVSNERADQFANRYYNDSYKAWIIYLTNNIIDPYYDWYMSDNTLSQFASKKYGNMANAYNKIKFFQNNWENGNNISVSDFNALPATLYKYWQPVYGNNNKILNYTRTRINYNLNTTFIRSYSISNTSFINDEICHINFGNGSLGSGQVLSVTTNTLFLQHTQGITLPSANVSITANSYIYGTESYVNTNFTTAVSIANNILPEEVVYWSPISYYQYETQKNEFNKTIRVLDSKYAQTIAINLNTVLNT